MGDPWGDVAPAPSGPKRASATEPLAKLDELALGVLKGVLDLVPTSIKRRLAEALVPIELAPPNASQAEQYEHYKRILEARGYTVDPHNPTVLAIRGMSSDGTVHRTESSGGYDDTVVVLTRDANGNPQVTTLGGATHPGQKNSTMSPDVTGDNVGDVGMIKPGEYRVEPLAEGHQHHGANAWRIKTEGNSGQLPGWRDTDHDGKISTDERAASESRGDTLGSVLIHQGGWQGRDVPVSVGCVTLSHNDVFERFTEAVGGERTSMKLVVVDAND